MSLLRAPPWLVREGPKVLEVEQPHIDAAIRAGANFKLAKVEIQTRLLEDILLELRRANDHS